MSHDIEIPRLFPLEQLALHEIAKRVWNILVLKYWEKISISKYDLYNSGYLKDYRKRVLRVLRKILPAGFSKLLKDKLVDASIAVRIGYSETYDWILCYRKHYDWGVICVDENLEQKWQNLLYSFTSTYKNKYEASRFINPMGHFDDLSWTKLLVADENQPPKFRFYLACHYCLEEEIYNLWGIPEVKYCITNIQCYESGALVKMWKHHLEHKTGPISSYHFIRPIARHSTGFPARPYPRVYRVDGETGAMIKYDDSFIFGYYGAFSGQYEHAVKFFLSHYSVAERHEILPALHLTDYGFAYLFSEKENWSDGFVHFIYFSLSVESKKEIMRIDYYIWVFVCMLCSNYYSESILNDILTFPDTIPLDFYKCILDKLACVIQNCSISLHKQNFKTLWNHISQGRRNKILSSSQILSSLSDDIDDFDLLETIILPLPRSMKEEVLLNDFQKAFRTRLEWFFKTDDYEGFLRYLLFFFLDYDSSSGKLSLRPDAGNLLDRLMNSKCVKRITMVFFTFGARKFNKVIKHFTEVLPVLKEEIKKMDRGAIPHYFLSRKIYPLFSFKDN